MKYSLLLSQMMGLEPMDKEPFNLLYLLLCCQLYWIFTQIVHWQFTHLQLLNVCLQRLDLFC